MSEGDIDVGAEKSWKYKSWYHDPEQVENLVLMLEEQRPAPSTDRPHWKYGTGRVYQTIFPMPEQDVIAAYTSAPIPRTPESFGVTIDHLASGIARFGPEVPSEIKERFFGIIKKRREPGAFLSAEKVSFWDNQKRLVAAGLLEYCSLTAKHAAQILENKLGREISKISIHKMLYEARRLKKFPYDNNPTLLQNNPLALAFVDSLKAVTGMSLEDVRSWLIAHDPEMAEDPDHPRLERLDDFIRTYERYRAREDNASSAPEQTR